MRWIDLAQKILEMSIDDQETDVTIYDPAIDEFFPAGTLDFAEECDVLDRGHPYIVADCS